MAVVCLCVCVAVCVTVRVRVCVQYTGLIQAVHCGDVQSYRAELRRHRTAFVRAGVYLLLEKLEPVVLRKLFKRVYVRCAGDQAVVHSVAMNLVYAGLLIAGGRLWLMPRFLWTHSCAC